MAGAGWRDFVAGEVLTAANVQDYLQDQAVMTFASSGARGSAIASPTEGMVSFLKDVNRIEAYDGSAWKQIANTTGAVLQVVSTTKADIFTTTSTTTVSITGLSATITPSSTTSKILVFYNISAGNATSAANYFALHRGATQLASGTGGSSANTTFINDLQAAVSTFGTFIINGSYLDSPSTTSATTYEVKVATATGTLCINRRGNDAAWGMSSTITVMEIAG